MSKRKLTPAQRRRQRGRKKSSGNKVSWKKRILRFAVLAVLAGVLGIAALIGAVHMGVFGKLPSEESLSNIQNFQATEVYSADKVLLGRYYIQERRVSDFDEISEHIIHALVATEDARFFQHNGVDYPSLARVLVRTILMQDRSGGGGSTISQQLAKNLYPRKSGGLWRIPIIKIKESIIAQRIEKIYSKEEIITLYLNTVPFGENIFGIEMASRRFFDKSAREIDLDEAAVLVGMLKANYTYNPRINPENAVARRNVVLSQMLKYEYIDEATFESAREAPLEVKYSKITHNTGLATYYREYLRPELELWCASHEKPDGSPYNLYTDGLKIYTTLDSRLQRYAEDAVESQMKALQNVFDTHWDKRPWKNDMSILDAAIRRSSRYKQLVASGLSNEEVMEEMTRKRSMKVFSWDGDQEVQYSSIDSIRHYLNFLQTGFVAMDPNKGDVKAWVGGIDFEYFKFDHANPTTTRQVGSTFKPFVFAAALEEGMDPCTYISGAQVRYTNLANWTPGNADPSENNNLYSFSGALAKSVNTVSVKVLESTGIDNTIELAKNMGISSELPEVPSIALGTADISLVEMVTAYSAFANGGKRIKPRYVISINNEDDEVLEEFDYYRKKERVMSRETASIMVEMLQDVVDEGTASRLRWKYGLNGAIAGKTGTTQSNADGWFIGFTRSLVVGCWVGADDPAIRFRSTALGQGANTAAPIFAEFYKDVSEDENFRQMTRQGFPAPSNRVRRLMSCPPIRENQQFGNRAFSGAEENTERSFGEEPVRQKRRLIDRIGNLFRDSKRKKKQ